MSKKKIPPVPRPKRLSADAICQRIAESAAEIPLLDEILEDSKMESLWQSLRDIRRADYRNAFQSESDIVLQFERFRSALPKAMQEEYTRYDDQMKSEEDIAQDAAYLVGVAVGRRLAGAR